MTQACGNCLIPRCALALLAVATCLMQAPTVGADDSKRVSAIERRLDLTQNYLNSSSAANMAAGDNQEAKQFVGKAREYHDLARKALADGDLDTAADLADQSLRAYSAASAARQGAGRSENLQASENKALRLEIETYLQAYLAALQEKGPTMAGLLNRRELDDLLARADRQQNTGDHQAANQSLRQGQQMVVTALTKIRSNETVVYTLEFQTPADEYRYERERYNEYLRLAQQVLASGQVGEAKTMMFDKVVQKGRNLNGQAEQLAGQGNFEAAISHMEQALAKLVQGLQLLGVPVSR